MAKVYNPLHEYRSYQYHFILVVTDKSRNAIRALDDPNLNNDISRFMRDPDKTKRYDVRESGGGKYVIVYNSMQDTDFAIDTLEYHNIMFMLDNGYSSGFSSSDIGTNLEMTIVEPMTADFLTALKIAKSVIDGNATEGASIDANLQDFGFGLKVIFHGFKDQNDEPVRIQNVPMLQFIIKKIQMSFTNKGAVYKLYCTPSNNNDDSLPPTNTEGTVIKTTNLLSTALADYESKINERAAAYNNGKYGHALAMNKVYSIKILLDKVYTDASYTIAVSNDHKDAPDYYKPRTVKDLTPPTDRVPSSTDKVTKEPSANPTEVQSATGPTNIPSTPTVVDSNSVYADENGILSLVDDHKIPTYSSDFGLTSKNTNADGSLNSLVVDSHDRAPLSNTAPYTDEARYNALTKGNVHYVPVDNTKPKDTTNESLVGVANQAGPRVPEKNTPPDQLSAENQQLRNNILRFGDSEDIGLIKDIRQILELCPKIHQEATAAVAYTPKITIADVAMSPDKTTAIINIKRVEHPANNDVADLRQKDDQALASNPDAFKDKLPALAEYDYIYTGKNVDVLSFDMDIKNIAVTNIEGSFSFHHPVSILNNNDLEKANDAAANHDKKKSAELAAGEQNEMPSTVLNGKTATGENTGVAGLPSVNPNRVGSGAIHPDTLYAARKIFGGYAFMNGEHTTIKVTGNPLLLRGTIVPADTFINKDGTIKSADDAHKAQDNTEAKTGSAMTTSGILHVKVNVRVPKPDYLQGTSTGSDDNFYSSPFWNDVGSYMVKSITTRFHRGSFDHVLELVNMGKSGGAVINETAAPLSPLAYGSAGGGSPKAKKSTGGPITKGSQIGAGQRVDHKEMYDYLKSKGLDDTQALAIMGNVAGESGFNPGASGDSSHSYGLFQWKDRRATDMKAAVGPDWATNWKGQIDYALSEPGEPGNRFLNTKFNNTQDAVSFWVNKWERPANPVKDIQIRTGAANGIKKELGI